MPFGRKQGAAGNWIEFDSVYRDLIAPAIKDAGLDAIRADQEELGGVIHKPMFERLVLCHYALADLTAASANVFYAARRSTCRPPTQHRAALRRWWAPAL